MSRSARPNMISKRSEEHTSELQSLTNLVCRLLLEKKKNHAHQSQLGTTDNSTAAPPRPGLHHDHLEGSLDFPTHHHGHVPAFLTFRSNSSRTTLDRVTVPCYQFPVKYLRHHKEKFRHHPTSLYAD